jgi:hypothetical protein
MAKQVFHKGFLMCMKKNSLCFESTDTIVWDTDDDKINSGASDSSSKAYWS